MRTAFLRCVPYIVSTVIPPYVSSPVVSKIPDGSSRRAYRGPDRPEPIWQHTWRHADRGVASTVPQMHGVEHGASVHVHETHTPTNTGGSQRQSLASKGVLRGVWPRTAAEELHGVAAFCFDVTFPSRGSCCADNAHLRAIAMSSSLIPRAERSHISIKQSTGLSRSLVTCLVPVLCAHRCITQ